MLPVHHPDPDVLLEYASGSLDEASSVLVATHLALCPACRRQVAEMEAVGGSVLEGLAPAALSDGALAAVLGRLDTDPAVPQRPSAPLMDPATMATVPQPLRSYLGRSLDSLPWRWRGFGIRECSVAISGEARASLLRIAPGRSTATHGHSGIETTLVLKGAFSDSTGHYARGDVATATADLQHSPVADASGECLCFAVVDGSVRLTGMMGKVLNPLLRT